MAESSGFARAPRLAAFLLYVCECQLLGRTDEITEQQIGIRVFEKAHGYNPAEDNVVRTYARQLRSRLEAYFEGDGRNEGHVIEIPRGKYIPYFVQRNSASQTSTERNGNSHRRGVALTCAACVLCFLAGLLARNLSELPAGSTPARALWRILFRPGETTLLVPGDSGLVMYQNLRRRFVPLSEYVSGQYQADALSPIGVPDTVVRDIGSRRYTSLPDLKLASRLLSLPQARQGSVQVRYARDVRLEDLKSGNAVLAGAPQGNPWVQLFDRDLNFRLDQDIATNDYVVVNKRPAKGEPASYSSRFADSQRHAYSLVALMPNLSRSGWVLLVEGTTMAGIEAAGDFLFSGPLTETVLDEALSHGRPRRFELLLESTSFGPQAAQARVIARRP